MFTHVLAANITTKNSTFKLKDIPKKDAKPEFTFYHKINKISPKILQELFAKFAASVESSG